MPVFQGSIIEESKFQSLRELLSQGKGFEVEAMQSAMDRDEDSWWYGMWSEGNLYACAHISNNTVRLFSISPEATVQMGEAMARSFGRNTGGTHRIAAPKHFVEAFWQGFKDVKRTLVSESYPVLLRLSALDGELSSKASVRLATAKDLAIVCEFAGEHSLEYDQIDPRRTNKAEFEKKCAEFIDGGEIYIGKYNDKFGIFAHVTRSGDTVRIERLHIPLHVRREKPVVAMVRALCSAIFVPGGTVIHFCDTSSEVVFGALKQIGFETVESYKVMILR